MPPSRRRRAPRPSATPPSGRGAAGLWQVLAGEITSAARESLSPVKITSAVAVAIGVGVALGPTTPGPVVQGGWRVALALSLGVVGAALAHGLLRRVDDGHADDPLTAMRVVAASIGLLLPGTVAVAYLLAAVVGPRDPAGTGLSAELVVDRPLLVGAALLLVGVLASGLRDRLRVPGALLFLAVGMILGDDGLDLVSVSDPVFVQSLGVAALVVILFEGGLTTELDDLRWGAGPGLVLATIGVAVTAGVTAVAAMLLLDLPSRLAWLIGAIVASTDAAAVFEVLRRTPLPRRLSAMLRIESGANDPVAVLLTVGLLLTWDGGASASSWLTFGALQLIGGTAVGVASGWLGSTLLRRLDLGASGLYPLLALAIAGVTYGLGVLAGASGFLAVYLAGVVIAHGAPRRRRAIRTFHGQLASGAEIGLFLLLGLLVFPSALPALAVTAIALTAVLTLAARPLAVAISLVGFGGSRRDVAAVSWLGMRGAVPIVLATLAFSAGIPEAGTVFHVVFFVVVVSVLVQGTLAAPLVRRLGLEGEPSAAAAVAEVLPLDAADLDLVDVSVTPSSRLTDRRLRDRPPPDGALVSAVVRDDRVLLPRGDLRFAPGDRLVVMTTDLRSGRHHIQRWADAPISADQGHPRSQMAPD